MNLHLFHLLMTILISVAPSGTTGCNDVLQKATYCWIRFENPTYIEYLSPNRIARLNVVIELARAGLIIGTGEEE